MLRSIFILLIGTLFGAGLAVGGMLNPAKVAGFLDLFGLWDPSLAFVMGGGVVVNFIGHRMVMKRSQPLFSDMFHIPTTQVIDKKLIAGAILFGIGWGLAGLCPGPAISSLLLNPQDGVGFVVLMLAGIYVGRVASDKIA